MAGETEPSERGPKPVATWPRLSCDDVEIMRDVSRINKEAVICNKGCFGLSSCPRGCIVPPRALPLRHTW